MIWLGCSGWSYKEWSGAFYPAFVRDQLKYYSQRFNSVEINSTFYGEPDRNIVRSWCSKIGDRTDFRFSIKMPGSITHDLFFRDLPATISRSLDFEKFILGEMDTYGKLGACLIQMPPWLSGKQWDNFMEMLSYLDTTRYRYFVETRNPDISQATARESLGRLKVGLALVDTPLIRVDAVDAGTNYIRLHGRNAEQWNEVDDKMSKYRYLYGSDEISEIASVIKPHISSQDDIFIYFNNHHEGYAPQNAIELGKALGIASAGFPEQKKLF
jgi:uncharacterized protein YecE (DUF72 family)